MTRRERSPTQHEIDCQIVRNFIDVFSTKTEHAVAESFERIARRALRTSPRGKDYVLHIQDMDPFVYCGRAARAVNSVKLADAMKDLDSDQWCKACVRRIKKEQTLRAR